MTAPEKTQPEILEELHDEYMAARDSSNDVPPSDGGTIPGAGGGGGGGGGEQEGSDINTEGTDRPEHKPGPEHKHAGEQS